MSILWEMALFIAGISWLGYLVWRLPGDLAELRRTFKRYRDSKNPHSLSALREKGKQREQHRKEYAKAFLGRLALQVFFFWPVSAFAIVAIVWFVHTLISIITRGS
ncbi:MAG: hypothetical protein FJ291_01070 [Planctomycetes bacterium]|nr:hypothetical protein [Planctomycetota bacterium]